MRKLLPTADVRAMIATVVAEAGKVQHDIHEAALQCIAHAEEHGDITLADHLVKELEANATGQRTATLRDWFAKFSPIRWNNKTGEVGLLKNKEAEAYTPFDYDAASASPYYGMGKEVRPKELTLDQLRKSLLNIGKRIERAEKGEGNVTIPEGEDIESMKTLARQAALVANGGVTPVTTTTEDLGEEDTSEEDTATSAVA